MNTCNDASTPPVEHSVDGGQAVALVLEFSDVSATVETLPQGKMAIASAPPIRQQAQSRPMVDGMVRLVGPLSKLASRYRLRIGFL